MAGRTQTLSPAMFSVRIVSMTDVGIFLPSRIFAIPGTKCGRGRDFA